MDILGRGMPDLDFEMKKLQRSRQATESMNQVAGGRVRCNLILGQHETLQRAGDSTKDPLPATVTLVDVSRCGRQFDLVVSKQSEDGPKDYPVAGYEGLGVEDIANMVSRGEPGENHTVLRIYGTTPLAKGLRSVQEMSIVAPEVSSQSVLDAVMNKPSLADGGKDLLLSGISNVETPEIEDPRQDSPRPQMRP